MERVKSVTSTGKEAKDSRDTTYRYRALMMPQSSGSLIYGVRVVPSHPDLAHPYGMGMALWA
jgi:glycogen phosphorylase